MHPYWRNDRVFKWCNQQGIHVTAYGPLSSPQMADSMDKDHLNLIEVSQHMTLDTVQSRVASVSQLSFTCFQINPVFILRSSRPEDNHAVRMHLPAETEQIFSL